MKSHLAIAVLLIAASASAFVAPSQPLSKSSRIPLQLSVDTTLPTRSDIIHAAASLALVGLIAPPPANARGRATLEQSYERYSPRIRAGGTFYATDLKKLVASADFEGVKLALAEPPSRQKSDLVKPDAGVAARARQAGQFSDARVLVAADLWASSFSESSISAKTKKMQESIVKVRDVIEEMQEVARLGLGEEKTGGLFGLGAKKADKNECAKKLRELYVQGGNAWNEYVLASNDNLPLQFDKFEFVK